MEAPSYIPPRSRVSDPIGIPGSRRVTIGTSTFLLTLGVFLCPCKGAYDCGCQIRGLHHLFIVFQWWSAGPWFWKPYGLGQFV